MKIEGKIKQDEQMDDGLIGYLEVLIVQIVNFCR